NGSRSAALPAGTQARPLQDADRGCLSLLRCHPSRWRRAWHVRLLGRARRAEGSRAAGVGSPPDRADPRQRLRGRRFRTRGKVTVELSAVDRSSSASVLTTSHIWPSDTVGAEGKVTLS